MLRGQEWRTLDTIIMARQSPSAGGQEELWVPKRWSQKKRWDSISGRGSTDGKRNEWEGTEPATLPKGVDSQRLALPKERGPAAEASTGGMGKDV